MDTVLLVITIISVLTAAVALASIWRLRRSERDRSEARIAALAGAAGADGGAEGWTLVNGELQWNAAADGTWNSGLGIRAANPEPQIPDFDAAPQVSTGTFFGTVQREEPSGSRLPIFAAAALIVMLGGALIFL